MSSEDQTVSPLLNMEKCSLVLVDVAGTTTSINFVKETLFPFISKHVETFLQGKWEEDSVKECVKQLQEGETVLEQTAAIELVKKLTEDNSPNPGLKTLQGLICKEGYEKGELKGHVFDEVSEVFENWAKSQKVAIYSTGSVDSQKLLFANSVLGDISGHISYYFDQSVGPKTETDSYKKIAKEVGVAETEVVFVTDDVEEATAAKSAGLYAILIKREGNADIAEDAAKEFTVISSFKDLVLEKAVKRKNEEELASTEEPPSKVLKTDEAETSEGKETNKSEEKETKSEEKETKTEEKEESMEVDQNATTATEETETEKSETVTEEKSKTADTEMKETENKTEEEMKVEEEKPIETEQKPEEKPSEVDEKKEESTPEADVKDEEKPTEKKEDEEKKVVENGDTEEKKSEEEPTTEAKVEEKENKSVLANSVENGNKEEVAVDGKETTEVTVEENGETEVIVKKLEETTESKTVSVEV